MTPDLHIPNIRLMPARRSPGRPAAASAQLTALGKWCVAKGISRQELAARLDIKRTSLDRLCNGARRPGLELAAKIEKVTRGEVPVTYWTRIPAHSGD